LMCVSKFDARRLSPAAQEVVRLRVVAALESGRVSTYGEAAEMFGVSQRSAGTRRRKYRAGGREVLAVPVKSRIGDEAISTADRAVLFTAMADSPEELLIGGPLWTRALVAEPIRMAVRVTMTEHGVGKWRSRRVSPRSAQHDAPERSPAIPHSSSSCSTKFSQLFNWP
jgi:hypothetical protein